MRIPNDVKDEFHRTMSNLLTHLKLVDDAVEQDDVAQLMELLYSNDGGSPSQAIADFRLMVSKLYAHLQGFHMVEVPVEISDQEEDGV